MIALGFFIQVKKVQTYLGHKATNYLSELLHTHVEVKSVDIEFFKKIVLEGVFIEDQHHDTLFFSKKLKVNIGVFNLDSHNIDIKQVELLNATSKIIQYKTDSVYNYQFIIDAFTSNTKSKSNSKPWKIKFDNVTLSNVDFTYRDETVTDTVLFGINYFDLNGKNTNCDIKHIRFNKDTIFGVIDHLSTKEKSGFHLENFSSANVQVSSTGIRLDKLNIKTPSSNVSTDLTLNYKKYSAFLDYNNLVYMKAAFNKATVDMRDISYFSPALKGLNKQLTISGKINGTVDNLRAKHMTISLNGSSTQFKGDVTLAGLPNIDETVMYLNIEQLKTNHKDLSNIPSYPFYTGKKIELPANIIKLGNISYKGMFTGLYNDFYSYGNLNSSIGNLSIDLSLGYDHSKKVEKYNGKIKANTFDVGYFIDSKTLGKTTANVTIEGYGLTLNNIAADLNGTISSLDFMNYNYKNILIEGHVAKKFFKGNLDVKDDNIDLNFNGDVDYSKDIPEFNFIATLNKANLNALQLFQSEDKYILSSNMAINMQGNNIDNLIGEISFNGTKLEKNNKTYKSTIIHLSSEQNQESKSLNFVSDFADGSIKGDFKILDLPSSLSELMKIYLPEYIGDKSKKEYDQNFEYEFKFKNLSTITQLFYPSLTIAESSRVSGNFNSRNNLFSLQAYSNKITLGKLKFDTVNTKITTSDNLNYSFKCNNLFITDSTLLENFNIIGDVNDNVSNCIINWDNNSTPKNNGNINTQIHFTKNEIIRLKLLPSKLVFSDSVWNISLENEIIIDTTSIAINKLNCNHNNESIIINGIISENKNDALKIDIQNFNLENVNFYTQQAGLSFKGSINGETTISNIYTKPLFLSKNTFSSFYMNDGKIGDGTIETKWNNETESLSLNGAFTLGIVPNISFNGFYYPKKTTENINIKLHLEAIQMKMFEPMVKDVCSDLGGMIEGVVNIKGTTSKPLVSGKLHVNAKKITVNYLKTSYNFSDDIIIDSNAFVIHNLTLFDTYNNKGVANGKLEHNNFKNFNLNFHLKAEKLLVLNTTAADNDLFYGKAFATGNIDFTGPIDNFLIDASLKTESINSNEKNDKLNVLAKTELTKINIPLMTQSELGENDFITFIKKDTIKKKSAFNKNQLSGITMNFNLEATPDAEVLLIFDQKVGDLIKATGSGNIKMIIDTKGEFQMYGDYVIENGDYLFTLKNLMNKKFEIEKGSSVKWNGIPYKADLNVTANYRTRALLTPFLDSASKKDLTQRQIVDIKLKMKGYLMQPDISFDINLPNVNSNIKQTVASYLNTESEMNKQVLFLLLTSSFVSPTQGATFASSASSNAFEMLSNQLNNMISNVSNDYINVGINYKPGSQVSKEQLDLAVSTQLFNDKLTIDGNLGVNNNNQNTQSANNTNNIVGDVNIDYKLTDDGKAKVKAFNRANNYTQIITNGTYTQGLGIYYREEFDTVGELYRRYKKILKRKKKNDNS